MQILEYLHQHSLLLVTLCGLLGLVVGSFLNVLVHRLPRMLERDWRQQALEFLHPEQEQPVSYTHLTLPTKRIV